MCFLKKDIIFNTICYFLQKKVIKQVIYKRIYKAIFIYSLFFFISFIKLKLSFKLIIF